MHDTTARHPDHARLFQTASGQHGYFTAAQAGSSGLSWDVLTHHTRTGRFVRVQRGLYRLRDYPLSPHDEVMAAWLALGADPAVASHETAFDLLELSDVIPNAIHFTVPRSKRYLRPPPGVVVHTTTEPVQREDTVMRHGVPLTTPTRTILDAAEAGTAPEQIEMAVAQALERGLTTARRLRQRAQSRSRRVRDLVERAIEDAQ